MTRPIINPAPADLAALRAPAHDVWWLEIDLQESGNASIHTLMDLSVPPHEEGDTDFHGFGPNEHEFEAFDPATGKPLGLQISSPLGPHQRVKVALPKRIERGKRFAYNFNYISRNCSKRVSGNYIFEWGWMNWPMTYHIDVTLPLGRCLRHVTARGSHVISGPTIGTRVGRAHASLRGRTEARGSIGIALLFDIRDGPPVDLIALPTPNGGTHRDFFFCHATPDKEEVVRPVSRLVMALGSSVWLDEAELSIGDRLGEALQRGIRNSRYVVVFISRHFTDRPWPNEELEAAFARERSMGDKIVLPVTVGFDHETLSHLYPFIASRYYYAWDGDAARLATTLHEMNDRSHR